MAAALAGTWCWTGNADVFCGNVNEMQAKHWLEWAKAREK
jgi:hypothetical protein